MVIREGNLRIKRPLLSAAFWQDRRVIYTGLMVLLCILIYYLPAIAGALGGDATRTSLARFHDFYGVDLYGLVFSIPVIYAAYIMGIVPAILTAFIVFIILIPHAIIENTEPLDMFRPAAFVIIMSAVGAVVAMLQKSGQEQKHRMNEMKCLFDIGKASDATETIDTFLNETVAIIANAMLDPEAVSVTIKYADSTYRYSNPGSYPRRIVEDIIVAGEPSGQLVIRTTSENPYIRKRNHLTRTLAERIGGAIYEKTLEQSVQTYYAQLEEEVANRIKDLEEVHEKLIRSERLSAVGEMASGVGHELRNPLNVIRNCVYLLRMSCDDDVTEEISELFTTLDKQVDVSNKIVTDLLDFTRIKAPDTGNHDLPNLIRRCLIETEIPPNIDVVTYFDDRPLVRVDEDQMSQVFINTITNAIQAMNAGGKLEINTEHSDGCALATFTDNGCGIPEKDINRIFEPLFTTRPKGIGLGLAISKRLAEQNGSTIDISSREGTGTVVAIKMPVAERIESQS